MQIRKRNNELINFQKDKIVQAIVKSMAETEVRIDEDLDFIEHV